jgi:hypothetical protein
MKVFRVRQSLPLIVICAILPSFIQGQQGTLPRKAASVAVLNIENAGLDPRVDYLSGIIGGLLAFDLGSRSDIVLTDRRNLDAVLREKELSLSALGTDASAAAEAGRLVGADWFVTGEYVFLGSDILITLSLTDTATAKRIVFRERGSDENLVHRLAEQIIFRLSGQVVALADPNRSRSLLSLRDEAPGSIALFSPIIKAEVFLDGEFVGYTTGEATTPFIIDSVPPGDHVVRVHLSSDFGVIDLPAVTFHDWEGRAKVTSGKRSVLRDETRYFNDILYPLIVLGSGRLVSKDSDSKPGSSAPSLAFTKLLSFQDRSGIEHEVKVEARPRDTAEGVAVDMTISEGPKGKAVKTASFSIQAARTEQKSREARTEAGIVSLRAEFERRSDSWVLIWRAERTDISQNMWQK